ncbi:MAG: carbohydrate ABC transporter permease [Clostridia bacterium]|nr:carbohydrate ABC transporter permease [Clostridia bacterium]
MRHRITTGEKIFHAINYIFLALAAGIALFPFINVIAVSLSSSQAIMTGKVFLWPVDVTVRAYKNLIEDGQLFYALKNTVIVTLVGTLFNILGTVMIAYPLSRKHLVGGKLITALIVFTMLFNGGLIPSFVLVKNLNIMNSFWALWLPALVSVYNMIIMKNFFENLPPSLIEAVQIDGANDICILFQIVLPLSVPVIATVSLFYCVGWWNNYFNVMIYITDSEKITMTVKIMQMINNFNDTLLQSGEGVTSDQQLVPEAVKSAAIVITTIPIMCVYPFLQKYFVKGVMIGSVKG